MIAPAIIGAGISAAGNLLGGLFGNSSARRSEARQLKYQKEFAQMGIRWRVNDAREAGLHPLYALGAQVPSYSPVQFEDSLGPAISQAGQNIGQAVAMQATPGEKLMQQLAIRKLQSEIDETDARKGYYDSETMRNRLAALGQPGFPNPEEGLIEGQPNSGQLGQTLLPENEQIVGQHISQAPTSYIPSEHDSSVGANVNPMWSRFQVGKNQEMVLPGGISGDAAEALESLAESPILMWMTYRENVARYGEKFTRFMFERYAPDSLQTIDKWWDWFINVTPKTRDNMPK